MGNGRFLGKAERETKRGSGDDWGGRLGPDDWGRTIGDDWRHPQFDIPTDHVDSPKRPIGGIGVAVGEEVFELDEAGFDLFAALVELVGFLAETFVLGDERRRVWGCHGMPGQGKRNAEPRPLQQPPRRGTDEQHKAGVPFRGAG